MLAICFNIFVNPIALEAIAWKYYFVFVVVCAIYGLTAYFFYPETRGYSLERMAMVFDEMGDGEVRSDGGMVDGKGTSKVCEGDVVEKSRL